MALTSALRGWRRILIWAVAAPALILQVIGFAVLTYVARDIPVTSLNIPLVERALYFMPGTLAWQIVGILIATRQPRNPVGWLFVLNGLCSALGGIAEMYWRVALWVLPGQLPGGQAVLWLDTRPYEVGTAVAVWILLLFPDGRLPSRAWTLAGWAATLGALLTQFVTPVGEADPSRWAGLNTTAPDGLIVVGIALQFAGAGAAAVSQALKWRTARGVERQQMKVMVSALLVYVISLVLLWVRIVVFGDDLSFWLNLVFAFGGAASVLVAVAAAFAILRYHIWDIDIILRRTLVYSALTVSLGAAYLLTVIALQAVFVSLTGSESPLAVVASTLAIAALFRPVRRVIQIAIDRRFYRRARDHEVVLSGFARRASQQADLDAISADLLTTVQDTLEPEDVSLWITPSRAP